MQALGAFIHGDTFSILFLYAESTLEKLLMEDFAGFASESIWKQILGITEALECLHNDDPVMIHSDIKPQNILLHDKTLKLADFGSSRLIDGIKSTENQDLWAGRVYSPPELNVRFPAYDIWSLGCVVSEVATSDAQKKNALIEYRSERTLEDEDIVNWPCFHKNKMMKAAVRERHKILLNLVQQNKGGNGEGLSSWQMRFYNRNFFGLVEQMLGPEDQRPSASEVVKQLRHFINQASEYDRESTGQPDVWQRSWAGTIPTSHSSYACRTQGESWPTHSSSGQDLEVITEDTECTYEDSAFVGSEERTDKQGMRDSGLYRAETRYSVSETSTLPPRDERFIDELAADLFGTVKSYESNRETLERISEVLPDLLRAFALKLGHKAQTPTHRDVSYFVHKYRR